MGLPELDLCSGTTKLPVATPTRSLTFHFIVEIARIPFLFHSPGADNGGYKGDQQAANEQVWS